MALTGVHTNWLTGSYAGDREYMLRAEENTDLFNGRNVAKELRPDFDGNNSLAIGYGLDLLVNSDATINSYLTAAGLQALTDQDKTVLAQARAYRSTQLTNNQPIAPLQMENFANQLSLNLLTDITARGLLNVVANDKESQLIHDLTMGGMSAGDLNTFSGTREFAALVSLKFNGISPVVRDNNGTYQRNTKMLDAILRGDRAEAWYEIRYNSNGNDLPGLAKRRFFEADTLGLYSAGASSITIPDAEAKGVFRMYTTHREAILAYEIKYAAQIAAANNDYQLVADQVETWAQDSQIAKQYLVTTYAEGRTIDGEVLVGKNEVFPGDILEGTANGDLLFGELGNDVLRGGVGTDVLYGGAGIDTLSGGADSDLLRGEAGDDTLQGGTGNDLLEGGAGFDTYIYNAGDGTDQIEDSDANGKIIFDQKLLQAGIRRTGDAVDTYTSLDGTQTYVISGGHLIVNGVLTVNANFQSGQFGITLRDVSEANYDNGLGTTVWSFGDGVDILAGIGGGNHIAHMGGGHDVAITRLSVGAGNDQLFGEDGNDQLYAGGYDDRLYGGNGDDLLVGDHTDPATIDGDDLLDGGAGADLLIGGFGDDVLLGGEGADVLWGDYGEKLFLAPLRYHGQERLGILRILTGDCRALFYSARTFGRTHDEYTNLFSSHLLAPPRT